MSENPPMKIIAILDYEIAAGGGSNQALNAILQMQKICDGRFGFEVFTTYSDNVPYLKSLGLMADVFTYSFIDRMLGILGSNGWWQTFQTRIKLVGKLEKKLMKHRCDLVYFVTPGSIAAALQQLNYITTVWDLAHRDNPEFPEVRNFNEYFIRERNYINHLGPAVVVLTDSKQLAECAAFRYGIDPGRFLPMPFAPATFVDQVQGSSKEEVLKTYGLTEGYFYYPAQFWAHKNHIRILEALLLLKADGWRPSVVFTGKDSGNRSFLEKFVTQHSLQEQVIILNYVPTEDMRGLYEGSVAVVMPTYFGPTNLPPLEAWSLGKPLIYSSHLNEQAGDAALLIDPDNASELAEAMMKCTDSSVCMQLVEAGKRRLQFIADQRASAESELIRRLERFATRRRCWQ
jgi:glycosyltransferase involved in cell wall biosynthesis